MVRKLADPPMRLEIGSARKTPSTPRPKNFGRISVRGTTMITFLKIEKKIDCLAFPSATKLD